MSKLSFRARALDAGKPMPIYHKDELSDLQDYSVLNRAVPQMPSGMEKEEESVSLILTQFLLPSDGAIPTAGACEMRLGHFLYACPLTCVH